MIFHAPETIPGENKMVELALMMVVVMALVVVEKEIHWIVVC